MTVAYVFPMLGFSGDNAIVAIQVEYGVSDIISKSGVGLFIYPITLMIILGYPGEIIVEGNLGTRWVYWAAAMVPFLYIVYE